MLPELIYREEKLGNHRLLIFSGFLAGLLGYGLANLLFPSEAGIVAAVFASIPLVYPLTQFFLEDEMRNRSHIDEMKVYLSLFIGQASAFMILGTLFPESFDIQISQIETTLYEIGITGYFFNDTVFSTILLNNLIVFTSILLISVLIASSGSFILTWNASVMGVFFALLVKEMPRTLDAALACTEEEIQAVGANAPSVLCYLPHAFFEITGFIIAGIAGSLISASIYRKHFDREVWIDYFYLVLLGAGFVVTGAVLESAQSFIGFVISLASIIGLGLFLYLTQLKY